MAICTAMHGAVGALQVSLQGGCRAVLLPE